METVGTMDGEGESKVGKRLRERIDRAPYGRLVARTSARNAQSRRMGTLRRGNVVRLPHVKSNRGATGRVRCGETLTLSHGLLRAKGGALNRNQDQARREGLDMIERRVLGVSD